MEYRVHQKTGDRISVLGMGTSYIADTPEKKRSPRWSMPMKRGSTMPILRRRGQRLSAIMGQLFHL